MPYSLDYVSIVKKTARQLHYELKILQDPLDEIKTYEAATSPSNHYPSLQLIKNGDAHPAILYGIKSKSRIKKWIQQIQNIENVPKTQPPEIRIGLWKETHRILLKNSPPSYFFRPYPSGEVIPYISRGRNYIYNSNTQQTLRVPGIVDPVPTPDGRFFTIPFDGVPFFGRFGFYIYSEPDGVMRKFKDRGMFGAYQSIGILRLTPHETTYRVITERIFKKGMLSFQDYSVNPQGRFRKIFKKPRVLCPEHNITLPMISKNASLIAGVDPLSRTMKLWNIDTKGNCSFAQDLGFVSGKADFSYDAKQIAVHISKTDPESVAYVVKHQSENSKLEAYIYHFESHVLEKMTDCNSRNKNCYYPNFLENGDVVVLEQDIDTSEYSFVFYTQRK